MNMPAGTAMSSENVITIGSAELTPTAPFAGEYVTTTGATALLTVNV